MKKLLLSCLLGLGIGAHAQLNYVGDFEEATNVGQYAQFGGGTIAAAAACSGTLGGQLAIGGTVTQTGWMVLNDVLEEEFGKINNGQEAAISFNYKKAAGVTGTLYAAVFTYVAASNAWNIEYVSTGTVLGSAAITTCTQKTGIIPAGKMQPGQSYGYGAWFVPSGSTTGNVFVDDLTIVQQSVTAVPACTTFTNPTSGAVLPSGTNTFTWPAVATAVNYIVTVGTTPGGNDVFGGVVAGTSQNVALAPNTTYYATVTPWNTVGEAVGCTGITFTTNNVVSYCGPLTSSAPTAVAPIKSVNFAGTTKTSDAAATTIGAFPAYEDFTTTIFEVKDNVTSLPLTVLGTTNGNPVNGWAMSVFIDWNSDGDFDDAGESYFNTTATMIRKVNLPDNPISLTGNIAIPAGTSYGQKRMRVKYNFSGTAIHTSLVSACAQMGNGQAEDYTINYQQFLAVDDLNKSNVSVYPNPFTDVVNISDIKGVKSINIVDVSGRTVKTLAPAAELNLGHLKSGMYFVNLQYADGSVKTVKSIKK